MSAIWFYLSAIGAFQRNQGACAHVT